MASLMVSNGARLAVPGLGKIRGLRDLSEKRVTKAVRNELRGQYGPPAAEVSCNAVPTPAGWRGVCKINGNEFSYEGTS